MNNIQIPNLQKTTGLVRVRGVWHARYYQDGKEKRKSLGTRCKVAAAKAQAEFYSGAETYAGRSVKDKLKDKPDLYVYRRPEWVFQIAGKIAIPCNTREEAIAEREKYLASL